ncbi:hypothetical protein ACFOW1_02370 [Parasediminibacterium paludis]|uniref:Uncharacterized protein n=1 Tax=Parasediminibacterium paludis TaxID=908966 RepID=A0ABV8PRM6_9BACT
MDLKELYKRATLYPSVITIIATIVFVTIDNYNYKSEWMTGEAFSGFEIIMAFFYCIFISALILPIFLNSYSIISQNRVFNFLSWFLLPMSLIVVVITHEVKYYLEYSHHFDSSLIAVIILNLPFLTALVWTYCSYIKHQKVGNLP